MATLRSRVFGRLAAVLPLVLVAPASADTVLIVGAGYPFATIQAAVDAASDGDVVLVKGGIYPDPVNVVQKGITIVGDTPPQVLVRGAVGVRDLLPHQTVLLLKLNMKRPATPTGELASLRVENTKGSVRVEDCVLEGPNGGCPTYPNCWGYGRGGPAVSASDARDLTFVNCFIRGGGGMDAVWAEGSNSGGNGVNLLRSRAALYGCEVWGGEGGEANLADDGDGGHGGHGLYLSDSVSAPLHTFALVSGSTIRGGHGGESTWCMDYDGAGGHGVSGSGLVPGSSLVVLDSTLQGGLGRCGMPNGQPNTLLYLTTNLPGTAQQASFSSPRREGQTITVSLRGTPGQAAFLIGSERPGFTYLPTYGGVLHVDPVQARPPTFLGILPASGTLQVQLVAPQLPAGVQSRRLNLQALFYGPTVGRVIGTPLMPLVLDAAF